MCAAVFLADPIEARRRPGTHRFRGTDYEKAICAVNIAERTDEDLPRGWTEIKQTEQQSHSNIYSYWGSLTKGETYSMFLINDDSPTNDCKGTVIKQVGESFEANDRRRGKLVTTDSVLEVLSEDSHEGCFLQLQDSQGTEIGCCEILHKRDYWKEKRGKVYSDEINQN